MGSWWALSQPVCNIFIHFLDESLFIGTYVRYSIKINLFVPGVRLLIFLRPLPLGQFVLSTKHCASPHHQTEGDPPSRVESLHEGSESHPHFGPPSRNTVCPTSLQARGAGIL